jgi:hypothetical protein
MSIDVDELITDFDRHSPLEILQILIDFTFALRTKFREGFKEEAPNDDVEPDLSPMNAKTGENVFGSCLKFIRYKATLAESRDDWVDFCDLLNEVWTRVLHEVLSNNPIGIPPDLIFNEERPENITDEDWKILFEQIEYSRLDRLDEDRVKIALDNSELIYKYRNISAENAQMRIEINNLSQLVIKLQRRLGIKPFKPKWVKIQHTQKIFNVLLLKEDKKGNIVVQKESGSQRNDANSRKPQVAKKTTRLKRNFRTSEDSVESLMSRLITMKMMKLLDKHSRDS